MTVHVGEMFTDITTVGAAESGNERAGRQNSDGRTTEEIWAQSAARQGWLRARTTATGYDD